MIDLKKPLQVRNLVTGKTYAVTQPRPEAGAIYAVFGAGSMEIFNDDGSSRIPGSVLVLENVPEPAKAEPAPTPAPKPLDLSKPLQVVDGGDVYPVVAFLDIEDEEEEDPIVAKFRVGDAFRGWYFDRNGSHYSGAYLRNVPDPEPEKLTLDEWVNVYRLRDGAFTRHWQTKQTKEAADKCAGPSRIACLHITREFKVGEGLK